MDKYCNEIISLLINKKYMEAYNLGREMLDFFWHKNDYKNRDIAVMDYMRASRYYEFASKRMLEEKRRETEMFEAFCKKLIEINKELVDS